MVIIEANRTAYSASDVRRTLTVEELINYLQEFRPDDKVIISNDNGYTFGGINYCDFKGIDEDGYDNENYDE